MFLTSLSRTSFLQPMTDHGMYLQHLGAFKFKPSFWKYMHWYRQVRLNQTKMQYIRWAAHARYNVQCKIDKNIGPQNSLNMTWVCYWKVNHPIADHMHSLSGKPVTANCIRPGSYIMTLHLMLPVSKPFIDRASEYHNITIAAGSTNSEMDMLRL